MINGADEDRAIEQYYKDLESGKIDWESHWHTRYMECKKERDDALMKAGELLTKLSQLISDNSMLFQRTMIAETRIKELENLVNEKNECLANVGLKIIERLKRECGNG